MTTRPPGAALRFSGADEVFFADRERGRAHGQRRSKRRAAALAPILGIDLDALPVGPPRILAVVGSKGKGTGAVFASATLAAAGLRVGTLTSPGFRSNRERIRVGGTAIGQSPYEALVRRVAEAVDAGAGRLPADGYLSPTGLFTLAAIRHFMDEGCDAWILEAGMGGGSDEVSLMQPGFVAVTPIFGEHLGVIGDSVADIAREKLSVASAKTSMILSLSQEDEQAARVLGEWTAAPVRIVDPEAARTALWPGALVNANAALGVMAARAMLEHAGIELSAQALRDVLRTVRLPGRLSTHRHGSQRWLVDAATNGRAARAALDHCRASIGEPSAILACVPDGKDAAGVHAALRGHSVVEVRTDAPHLAFTHARQGLPSLAELQLESLGDRVLALGTVHFIGDVLEMLDVNTEESFTPPRR